MAVSGQSNFGKFIEAAEWAAELSGKAQLILRGLETHDAIELNSYKNQN